MYAGLPILGPNLYDIKELIKNENIGDVCDMSDIKSIVNGIKLINGNKKYFYKNKIEKLRNKYSFEKEFNKVTKLYKSFL